MKKTNQHINGFDCNDRFDPIFGPLFDPLCAAAILPVFKGGFSALAARKFGLFAVNEGDGQRKTPRVSRSRGFVLREEFSSERDMKNGGRRNPPLMAKIYRAGIR